MKTHNLPITAWEKVISKSLHSIRSLLCTSTNETPHKRFFQFLASNGLGTTPPSWLSTTGPVLLRNHAATTKCDPLVCEAELLHANPTYVHIRLPDGRETPASLEELARCPMYFAVPDVPENNKDFIEP